MGHVISGLLADFDLLDEFSKSSHLPRPARLEQGLGFLPLSDDYLDGLFADNGEFEPAFTYLSAKLKEALTTLSAQGAVAYIETDYFGGEGSQGAVVYHRGRCIMEPVRDEIGPVSRALALLGVARKAGGPDEFAVAGLDRYRSNDDWMAAGETSSRPGCAF